MPTLTTLSCQLWPTVIPMMEAQLFQYRICIDMTIILTMYTAPTKFNLYSLLSGIKYVRVSFSVALYLSLFGIFLVLFGVFSVLFGVYSYRQYIIHYHNMIFFKKIVCVLNNAPIINVPPKSNFHTLS